MYRLEQSPAYAREDPGQPYAIGYGSRAEGGAGLPAAPSPGLPVREAEPANVDCPGPYPSTVHVSGERLLGGTWGSSVVEFPDGGLERTVYWLPVERSAKRGARRVDRVRTDSDKRAAKVIRSLIRQHKLTVMWTLTYPEPGQHDRAEAFRDMAGWLKDYGADLKRGNGYVTVLEPHPDGHGWHIHLFTSGGGYPKSVLAGVRESWTAYLGRRGWNPSGGASWLRVHVKLWRSTRRAAYYAAKYATKTGAEGRQKGHRRYSLSLGLRVNVTRATGSKKVLLSDIPGKVCVRAWESGEDPTWQGYPAVWQAWEESSAS